jgi:signal transduction histidine kinase
MIKFNLPDFLQDNRSKIIEEWVRRIRTGICDRYSLIPREEIIESVGEAFEAYLHIFVHDDFSYINRYIEKITPLRLEAGLLLSDLQKALGLHRSVVVPLLMKETAITTIEDFCDVLAELDRCVEYTIHRFSDHFQDMHEKKALEHNRKLEEARRLAELGKMANRVAHELRNPLTVVGGFSRRLYKKMADDDPDKEYLAIVIEAVEELENNVSKIIDFQHEQ